MRPVLDHITFTLMYKPYFEITPKITKSIEQISGLLIDLRHLEIPQGYKKEFISRINAEIVHSSTAIEGNTLSSEQVEKVLRGEIIHAIPEEIIEVKNYNNAIQYLSEISKPNEPITETDIRQIHNFVLAGTKRAYTAGKYRDVPVIVGRYSPPPAYEVPQLMKELCDWLKEPQGYSTFLVAGITHYRFVEIHPFIDGNGRSTRLLTKLILIKGGYDIRQYFSLESFYNKDRSRYYSSLESAQEHSINGDADLTFWLEYFLEGLLIQAENAKSKITELIKDKSIDKSIRLNKNQQKLLSYINNHRNINRIEYMKISDLGKTAAINDLNTLVKLELINKEGESKATIYTLSEKGKNFLSH